MLEIDPDCVAQAGFEPEILLPQCPKGWGYRYATMPSSLSFLFCKIKIMVPFSESCHSLYFAYSKLLKIVPVSEPACQLLSVRIFFSSIWCKCWHSDAAVHLEDLVLVF